MVCSIERHIAIDCPCIAAEAQSAADFDNMLGYGRRRISRVILVDEITTIGDKGGKWRAHILVLKLRAPIGVPAVTFATIAAKTTNQTVNLKLGVIIE